MNSFVRTALLCSTIVLVPAALANDSSAMLGAGGLVLTKSADIRMASEDLFISPKQVKVHYTFVNDSGKDIDTVVAFPLPDVDNYELSESPIGTTVENGGANFVGFKVTVDGKPVAVTAEERAFLKGKDITAQLRAAHLPIDVVIGGYDMLNKLTRKQAAPYIKAGLLEDISGGQGDPAYHATWTTRTSFWWKAHFPAGKTVTVDHTYQPVTGQTFFGTYVFENKEQAPFLAQYCIDPGTKAAILAALAKLKKKGGDDGLLNQYTTAYILKTATNWKGPIGKFHLTVDKLKPTNIISLCWGPDLKKTGPTRFEATRTNFTPTRDIDILTLEMPDPSANSGGY
ncbi:MAG: DUF4424 family protein [Alphaproteobacteria bacterium]|nr:DUF4424 family protein [Alphaproteobacteria bacterium]